MPDDMTPEQRHQMMSRIRSINTKLKMIVRRYLHRHGFWVSVARPLLPGKPDIVLKKHRTVASSGH
jgi:DNA mismatch endonuclease (patch repair protein)